MAEGIAPGQAAQVPLDPQKLSARNGDRSTVVSQRGMVCSSQPLASVAGLDVLKKGGSAVDAAVAANAVLSVVEPMSCGPGGDLFAMCGMKRRGGFTVSMPAVVLPMPGI